MSESAQRNRPFQKDQQVTIAQTGEYEGKNAVVVDSGTDAAGNAVVIVRVADERSGNDVLAGFAPGELS